MSGYFGTSARSYDKFVLTTLTAIACTGVPHSQGPTIAVENRVPTAGRKAQSSADQVIRVAGEDPTTRSGNASSTVRVRRNQQAAPGSQAILEAEELLSNSGYWTGPIDGVADAGFQHSLMAFQKVEGRPRTGRFDENELVALRAAKRPLPLETGAFHVEIDLERQVLFVVENNGTVSKILPVSTGDGESFTSSGWTRRASTPAGRFKIFRKVWGLHRSELGLMYYPSYIVGGVAIHGSTSIPAIAASHGCIRIPLYAAKELYELTPIGTTVIVHRGIPAE